MNKLDGSVALRSLTALVFDAFLEAGRTAKELLVKLDCSMEERDSADTDAISARIACPTFQAVFCVVHELGQNDRRDALAGTGHLVHCQQPLSQRMQRRFVVTVN